MSYDCLLTEDAVYWPPDQPDVFNTPIAGEPEQIKVRWQVDQRRRVSFRGVEFISVATVYASKQLEFDGWLYRGNVDDMDYPSAPRKQPGAFQIKNIERSQNPSGCIVVYKHILGGGTSR